MYHDGQARSYLNNPSWETLYGEFAWDSQSPIQAQPGRLFSLRNNTTMLYFNTLTVASDGYLLGREIFRYFFLFWLINNHDILIAHTGKDQNNSGNKQ